MMGLGWWMRIHHPSPIFSEGDTAIYGMIVGTRVPSLHKRYRSINGMNARLAKRPARSSRPDPNTSRRLAILDEAHAAIL